MRYGIRDTGCGLAAAIVLLSVAAFAQEGMELSGFRVPEYDGHGEMTSQLFGEYAKVLNGGDVEITGLRIEFYEAGEVVMEVASPGCLFNRDTRQAVSTGEVTAVMEEVRIRGRGFELDGKTERVKILNDARVDINDVMEQVDPVQSLEVARGESVTTIESKTLDMDYQRRRVTFEEDVVVVDPEMRLTCETLSIELTESNEIRWIEALSNVRIRHDDKDAQAGRVVYDMTTDAFLLEDNPLLRSGRNLLAGDRIRYWRAGNRMVCEPAARLVIHPDSEWNKGLLENRYAE